MAATFPHDIEKGTSLWMDAWLRLRKNRAAIVCIGPVTSETARACGLRVDGEATTFTIPGLVDAVRETLAHGGRPE